MSFTRDKNCHQLADLHVRPVLTRLAPIPAREWRHAATLLRHVALAPGEALTRAGDVASHLGFVVRGLVRKVHVTERGTTVVRDFGGPGAVVGAYVSLLTKEPSYLSVEALKATDLLVLDAARLDALYARHTCWQIVGRRFAEIALVEREQRAHELLTASATERYRLFCQRHGAILPDLRSYDIASYLGITPVSLSRLRARARRAGHSSR